MVRRRKRRVPGMYRRWWLMDKVIIIVLLIVGLLAYFDYKKTWGFDWDISGALWGLFSGGSFSSALLWLLVFLGIGLLWFWYTKDKSESLALGITPVILVLFGLQSLLSTLFKGGLSFAKSLCWADSILPVKFISDLFKQSCPNLLILIVSVLIGGILAYKVYQFLQEI